MLGIPCQESQSGRALFSDFYHQRASFFCHRKVKPFYKTNNMQTLKLLYKEKSKDYAFD